MKLTLDERRDLCGDGKVTLNGKPARVVGAMCDFASVYQIVYKNPGSKEPILASVTFAWETIAAAVAEKRDLKA